MNVLVLTTALPFVHGGAEELRDNLVAELRKAGVTTDVCSIPFRWQPAERLVEEIITARGLRFESADRVIALRFPVYTTPHPNKVIWLVHQFRQAYDLWDAGVSELPRDTRGQQLQRLIRSADANAFANAKHLFAVSPVVNERLERYHGRSAEVLSAPLNDPELFTGGRDDGYLLAVGRVGKAKRQALLLRALFHAPKVRLVVAGPPDSPEEAYSLLALAAELGLESRVVFHLELLPRNRLAELVNGARAVVYIPFDEDSVGYVTMEAFKASKPVVTTADAGGVLEIVRDQETGLVVDPLPESLGAAFRCIDEDATLARQMGSEANQVLELRGLTWENTVERLLA